MNLVIYFIGAAVVGAIGAVFVFKKSFSLSLKKREEEKEKIIAKAHDQAKEIHKDTEGQVKSIEEHTVSSIKQMESLIETMKKNVEFKEQSLEKKEARNKQVEGVYKSVEGEIKSINSKRVGNADSIREKLAQTAGVLIDKMKEDIISAFKGDCNQEILERVKKREDHIKDVCEKLAKNIIRGSIQKFADRTSVEKKEANIKITRADVKERIIGKNGSNLHLLEELLDVDIVFNDEPDTITVSCFDLYRRTTAAMAIEKLAKSRTINDEITKKIIKYVKEVLDKDILEVGKKSAAKMGFKRKFPDSLLKLIGRLKYRTSYGQNILLHSFEVAYMAELLASELGIDVETAKIGAFFHDIGKAIDHEVEGGHDFLTKEIMSKYDFSPEEIHAAWSHHEAIPLETSEARIVQAADAISAGRPGARQESLSGYLERLKALEELSSKFEGVKKSYAISAGREVRVFVDPLEVKDEDVLKLPAKIAREIEEELSYPGKIKVNVIKRSKVTEFAK